MRFLADVGVARSVIVWLRDQGHDAVHLLDEGLERFPDIDVFSKAASENRVLLTFDLDFGEIARLHPTRPVTILLFRLQNARGDRVISRLGACLAELDSRPNERIIVVAEEHRIRVRRLPIGA